jgi:hypothetical protein
MSIDISNGIKEIKHKDTWKRVGALTCGSLVGSLSVMLTNKLTKNNSKVVQYGAGTLASGVITVVALGMGYDNLGMGSAMVSSGQALNTITSLVFDKNISKLMN